MTTTDVPEPGDDRENTDLEFVQEEEPPDAYDTVDGDDTWPPVEGWAFYADPDSIHIASEPFELPDRDGGPPEIEYPG